LQIISQRWMMPLIRNVEADLDMDRAAEISLLKKLLHYIDTKTTSLADAPWRNNVTAYTCPERHKREEELLIRGRPIVMGLSCDWPKPGAYRTDDFAGVPILTVRGSDGTLRAFLNVCRHRGAKIARGSGSAGAFTCPYHGWTYGNDGMLRGLPEEAMSFPGVRTERPGLIPLPIAEKYGMVWVLPTPAAGQSGRLDIDPWLEGLEADLRSWKLDTYHFHARHVHPENMNWKLLVDTFHEGYHFGFLHKESLKDILVHNVGDFTPFGPNFRLVFGRTKLDRLKSMPESDWDLMWNTTIVYSMFANTIFSPQGDHMEVFRIFPVDGRVDRAVMETSLYIPKPVETADEKRHWDANLALAIKVITTEDFPAGRTMQMGFGSGAQSHVIYGRNEPALAHYHKSIRHALGLPADEEAVALR
jgi:phenylpropionate dioxygenase-like ring-hydroxylating dioxygenase large terminal subunit